MERPKLFEEFINTLEIIDHLPKPAENEPALLACPSCHQLTLKPIDFGVVCTNRLICTYGYSDLS